MIALQAFVEVFVVPSSGVRRSMDLSTSFAATVHDSDDEEIGDVSTWQVSSATPGMSPFLFLVRSIHAVLNTSENLTVASSTPEEGMAALSRPVKISLTPSFTSGSVADIALDASASVKGLVEGRSAASADDLENWKAYASEMPKALLIEPLASANDIEKFLWGRLKESVISRQKMIKQRESRAREMAREVSRARALVEERERSKSLRDRSSSRTIFRSDKRRQSVDTASGAGLALSGIGDEGGDCHGAAAPVSPSQTGLARMLRVGKEKLMRRRNSSSPRPKDEDFDDKVDSPSSHRKNAAASCNDKAAASGAEASAPLTVSDRVQRGIGWVWGDQDGGPGGLGTVLALTDWKGTSGGVRVLWDQTHVTNTYRQFTAKPDLKLVSSPGAASIPSVDISKLKDANVLDNSLEPWRQQLAPG